MRKIVGGELSKLVHVAGGATVAGAGEATSAGAGEGTTASEEGTTATPDNKFLILCFLLLYI